MLDAGYRISEAAERVKRRTELVPPQGSQFAQAVEGMALFRAQILDALLSFDRGSAERITRRLVTVSFEVMLDEIYLPILHETGARWESGQVSVVQEHFVSAWCRERILVMARSLEPGAPTAPEAICATPEGEHHEFGLLGAAFRLASRGYRLLYLGTNVPTDQLLALVKERQPALVALSIVLEREDLDIVAYGEQILAQLGPGGRVLIGGRAADALAERSTDRLLLGATSDVA